MKTFVIEFVQDLIGIDSEGASMGDNFFLVWCEGNGVPTVKHANISEAKAEALRLAEKHSGKTFHVLYTVGVARQAPRPVEWKSV